MSKTMKNEKQALVPRLRFPEFRDAGEWVNESMGDLYGFYPTNTFSRDKLNYTKGDVKNIHYGDIHTKFATLFDVTKELVPFINGTESVERIRPESYCIEGDVIFADASEDMEDVGKSIEIVNTNNEKIVSGLHTILARQLTNRLAIRFGGYLFKSGAIREQIKKEAQGAKVLGISSGRLSRIKVCYPSDREEQQKIADCLSSLDALITAQADKVDTLKTHKKGLMQQLFPREGETVPRLRFPEFRDAGEWRKCKLEEMAKRGSGHTPNKKYPSYYNGGIKWVSLADSDKLDNGYIFKTKHEISEEGLKNSSAVLHSPGTVILSRDAGVGKSGVLHSPMAVSQHFIAWCCEKSKLSNWFLYYFLQKMKPTFESIAVGNTIKTIGLSYFKDMMIVVPAIEE
ncbi:restriction endonuclease subunit S, partial [Marinobacter sp. Z-F4-2]